MTILIFILLIIIIYKYIYQDKEPFRKRLYTWNKCKINDQTKLKNTFNEYGCIIIPSILSTQDCDNILSIIEREERNKNAETGNINSNFKRKDIYLSLNDTKEYIAKIYEKIKIFVDELIPDARVVESSSLISYPGAYPQIWHSDTNYTSPQEGNLVSFGIALDDITYKMGPLDVYLESNKMYTQDEDKLYEKHNLKSDNLQGNYDDGIKYQSIDELCKLEKYKKVDCSATKGSLVIWSSKVIHRGGENTSKRRPIFYFSLLGKGKKPHGATYSMKSKDQIVKMKDIV